jgi:hypothetical protein
MAMEGGSYVPVGVSNDPSIKSSPKPEVLDHDKKR